MRPNAFWLNRYVLAWAVSILAYFVLHSKTRITIQESRLAALKGGSLLEEKGRRDTMTRRIWECVRPYVERVE
jgi:hypothetical protein